MKRVHTKTYTKIDPAMIRLQNKLVWKKWTLLENIHGEYLYRFFLFVFLNAFHY